MSAARTFVEAAARFAQDGVAARLPDGVAATARASPVHLAVFHQMVGATDEALAVLEQAHRERHPHLTALTVRPELIPLSESPRCRAILADLGLPSR